jgi:hypothetical protein
VDQHRHARPGDAGDALHELHHGRALAQQAPGHGAHAGAQPHHLFAKCPDFRESVEVQAHLAHGLGVRVGHELRRDDLQHPRAQQAGLDQHHPDGLGLRRARRQEHVDLGFRGAACARPAARP